MVTWHEAVAFCALADRVTCAQTGASWPWRARSGLPTEAEWEKAGAAEHGGERIYPWGDESDPNRANYDETGIGTTSAVGCFPAGPALRVQDLSGNVWEWTQS